MGDFFIVLLKGDEKNDQAGEGHIDVYPAV